jgi:hypothetical protein
MCDGLQLVLGDRSSEGVEDCLSIIYNLGRNPNARVGGRHIDGANLGMSDIVDLRLGHESSLEVSELFREGGSLRLELGQGVINNLCANPNADVGGWFHDGLNFSLGKELRLCLLDGLRSGVSESLEICQEGRQGCSLGGSESMFNDTCAINDFR